MFCSTHENCPPRIHSGRSLSNQVESGSVIFQPCYFDEPKVWAGYEAQSADWLFKPPADRALRDLEIRFLRWRAKKDEMDAEWREQQLAKVNEIAKEINADQRKASFELLERDREAHFASDVAESAKFTDALAELLQQKRDSDHAARVERANKAGREIARSRAKAERKILRARGVLR